jgi:hypothetical protein
MVAYGGNQLEVRALLLGHPSAEQIARVMRKNPASAWMVRIFGVVLVPVRS